MPTPVHETRTRYKCAECPVEHRTEREATQCEARHALGRQFARIVITPLPAWRHVPGAQPRIQLQDPEFEIRHALVVTLPDDFDAFLHDARGSRIIGYGVTADAIAKLESIGAMQSGMMAWQVDGINAFFDRLYEAAKVSMRTYERAEMNAPYGKMKIDDIDIPNTTPMTVLHRAENPHGVIASLAGGRIIVHQIPEHWVQTTRIETLDD